jgi:hypothetical protein
MGEWGNGGVALSCPLKAQGVRKFHIIDWHIAPEQDAF